MSQVKRARRFPERVQEVIEKLRKSNGLDAFQKLLPVEAIDAVLTDVGHTFRDRLYTPAVSLWVFLSQVLSTDHSCTDAVARLLAWRMARGESPCSPETGAYCSARCRLFSPVANRDSLLVDLAVPVGLCCAGSERRNIVHGGLRTG